MIDHTIKPPDDWRSMMGWKPYTEEEILLSDKGLTHLFNVLYEVRLSLWMRRNTEK